MLSIRVADLSVIRVGCKILERRKKEFSIGRKSLDSGWLFQFNRLIIIKASRKEDILIFS